MRPPDRNAGFTLLEMLAALAVIALVSAISIPRFARLLTQCGWRRRLGRWLRQCG